MAQAQTGGRGKRSASTRKSGGSAPPQSGLAAQDLTELQREYVAAHAEYAKTVREALEQLGAASANAHAELAETMQGLSSELREGGEAAARKYPERLQRALANPDHATRVSEAHQSYVEALRALTAGHAEAERSAREAYHDYVAAVQGGEAEDEVRSRGERARQAQADALAASAPSGDLHRKALEAQRNYEQVLRETQASVLQEVADAMREYAGSGRAVAEEQGIPKRYEEAIRRYQSRITDVTMGAQQALLEAQIGAIRKLQAGWTNAAAASSAGSDDSNGGGAGP